MCFRTITIINHKGSDSYTEILLDVGEVQKPWGKHAFTTPENFEDLFKYKAWKLLNFVKVKDLVHSTTYKAVIVHRNSKLER